MTPKQPGNLSASVRQRLLNIARKSDAPFDLILTRFALERLLYRLGESEWKDKFVLKGALLFTLWLDAPHRPTRDLDLLGFGANDAGILRQVFASISALEVAEDGLVFLPETVRATEILEDNEYHGVRIQLIAVLDGARIPVQVDVGFGDVLTPAAEDVTYPTLLPFSPPKLRACSKYTVVAEKCHIIATKGIANSRMKDFFDAWMLARRFPFDGEVLSQALRATFERRRTLLSGEIPFALTSAFFEDRVKRAQWGAFIGKNRLSAEGITLAEVVGELEKFFVPPLIAASNDVDFDQQWPPAGPWREVESKRSDDAAGA